MICAVCMRKFKDHSLQEVKECTSKFEMIEVERAANNLCISCGSEADLLDPDNTPWCNGCLAWHTQLNDESSDRRLRKDLYDEGQ